MDPIVERGRGAEPRAGAMRLGGRWLVGILGVALALRVAWALAVPVMPISDSAIYEGYARMVATGQGYALPPEKPGDPVELSCFWPPGTNFAYAALFRVFGTPDHAGYAPILVFNIVLGVSGVWLLVRLVERVLSRRIALVAGALMALWPMGVEFSSLLQSEVPFTFLVLLGMVAWVELKGRPVWRGILAGLVFAAATYVRPTALLLPVALALIELVPAPRRATTVLSAGLALLVMGAGFAPWALRNQRIFGEFVLISANSGSNLWMGNNPNTKGEYMPLPPTPGLNEAQRDRHLGREAKAYIRAHPGAFLGRTLYKLAKLHDRQNIGVGWNERGLAALGAGGAITAMKVLSSAYQYAVLGLGVLGAGVVLARHGVMGLAGNPLLGVWAYFALLHAIYVTQDRYSFPLTPMVMALAAKALVVLVRRRRGGGGHG